jgi:hypothetical protein
MASNHNPAAAGAAARRRRHVRPVAGRAKWGVLEWKTASSTESDHAIAVSIPPIISQLPRHSRRIALAITRSCPTLYPALPAVFSRIIRWVTSALLPYCLGLAGAIALPLSWH